MVSVVVLNWNRGETTAKCIRSLAKTKYADFEVIILDNGSTDGSFEMLQREFHTLEFVHIIRAETNLGFAGGNNFASKSCNGDMIVFLNNDTVVDPNWLGEMVECMASSPDIAACQAKLKRMDQPHLVDGAGDFLSTFGTAFTRGHMGPDRYFEVEEIFSARGAALMTNGALFERVGGFDDSYFASFEDVDLCWRLRLVGYRIVLVPSALVYHSGAMTVKRLGSDVGYFHYVKNQLMTIAKNSRSGEVLVRLPLAVAFDILAGRPKLVFAAVLWNLRRVRSILKKRQSILRLMTDSSVSHTRGFILPPAFDIYSTIYGFTMGFYNQTYMRMMDTLCERMLQKDRLAEPATGLDLAKDEETPGVNSG